MFSSQTAAVSSDQSSYPKTEGREPAGLGGGRRIMRYSPVPGDRVFFLFSFLARIETDQLLSLHFLSKC